ncbi:MAG: HI1506-related protein [Methylococcaceae bacterium]
MILISAKPTNGFYRCGIFHPTEQVEHDDKAFTKEQLEILKDEPMLSVFESDKKPAKAD